MQNNIFPIIKKTISKFLLDEDASITKKNILRIGLIGCLSGFASVALSKPVYAEQQFPDLHFNCVATVNCDTSVMPVKELATATFENQKKYFTHGNGFYEEYNDHYCDTIKKGHGSRQEMLNKYYPEIKELGDDWEGYEKKYDTNNIFGPQNLIGPLNTLFDKNNNFAHNNNIDLSYLSPQITATHDHSLDFCSEGVNFESRCDATKADSSANLQCGSSFAGEPKWRLLVSCEGNKIEECSITQKITNEETLKLLDKLPLFGDPNNPYTITGEKIVWQAISEGDDTLKPCNVKQNVVIIKQKIGNAESCFISTEKPSIN